MKAYQGWIPFLLLAAAVLMAGADALAQEREEGRKKTIEWNWERAGIKDKSKALGEELRREAGKLKDLLDLEKMEAEVKELMDLSPSEGKAVRGLLEDFRSGWIKKEGVGITIDRKGDDDRFDGIAEEAGDLLGEERADRFIDWLHLRQDQVETQADLIEASAEKLAKGLGKWAEEYGKSFADQAKAIEQWAEQYGKAWDKWGEDFGKDFGKKFEKNAKVLEEWAEQFGENWEEQAKNLKKWGERFGKDLEKWEAQFGKDWEKWGERFGEDMKEWGEKFGKDWEKWGEKFGKDWEKWGEELGRKLEGFDPDSPDDIARLSEILSRELPERLKESIDGNLRQSLRQLERLREMNLEGLDRRIQEAVQKSLSGIEVLEMSEGFLRENMEKAGEDIFKATEELRKQLEQKRRSWDLESGEAWEALMEALKDIGEDQHGLEDLEIKKIRKETMNDLLRKRIEEIKQQKQMEMERDKAKAERERERQAALEKLKLERDAIKLRDRDLYELQKEIEALKKEIRELKKQNRQFEKERDSEKNDRQYMML